MLRLRNVALLLVFLVAMLAEGGPLVQTASFTADDAADCHALLHTANLTIISAEIMPARNNTPSYCYVMGLIEPGIHWHMQMPLPSNWNGRLLNVGNGGKAGNLVFSDHRVAEGFAVANSNTGHDNGAEPNSSFGMDNLPAIIDYGYRAVHVVANASKTLTKAYYGKEQHHAYWEGCSTGGRQGMMEAQRFPWDFDGIVVGAPVIYFQALNAAHVWSLQQIMRDHYAGSLAYDVAGDGSYKSLTKLQMLRNTVIAKCDAIDGITDGVIDDPTKCQFDVEKELAPHACPNDKDSDECFTKRQIETVKHLYEGPHDSKGRPIYAGVAIGSEFAWAQNLIPYGGNKFTPSNLTYEIDHMNYLFYEKSPGVTPPNPRDLTYKPDTHGEMPEFPWWEFNVDDVTAGKGEFMSKITDATDPDLTRYLTVKKGKLLMYNGWGDGDSIPGPVVDYYKQMSQATFKGDMKKTQDAARLFMVPGMGHCGGGPGPNEWEKLQPLVDWVEKGKAPDSIVAVHRSDRRNETETRKVDNERKLCPYPEHGVYVGPKGGENDRANWVEKNFVCR